MHALHERPHRLSDAIEEPGGVIVSYGEDGEPVSVEFLNASARRFVQSGEVTITYEKEKLASPLHP